MAGIALQKFSLSELARATQESLDWKNWGAHTRRRDAAASPSAEVLDKLIEAEIIPRLMLTARASTALEGQAAEAAEAEASPSLDDERVSRFARRAIQDQPDALINEVRQLKEAGLADEDVLLKLLAPAARRLGRMWEEDVCDFADVTIGLMKLHRVLEFLNAEGPCGMTDGGDAPKILLAPAPGDQHVFGVVMVGELFARSGWRVSCETICDADTLVSAVSRDYFDVVGLSVSAEIDFKTLKALIRHLRKVSRNPDLSVMVGGHAFNEDIGLAKRIGADATAADGVRAVVTAERMVHRLARAGGALQS